jgi:glutathione S-transferase
MIVLHYFPGNASLTPHLLLRELGVPFELALVDRTRDAQKSDAYLALNPNGLIPVLQDGPLVLYETAAIVLHLVDTHPQAGLAPMVGGPDRAEFVKWLVWLASTPHAMMIHYFYPERMVASGNAAGAAEVRAQAEAKLAAMLDQIEARLTAAGPWMMGERFGALDPYVFMLGRWSRGMQRPARALPAFGAFLQRMLERPATRAVLAAERLPEPWV